MKIKELYTDENKWTYKLFARDAEGHPRFPNEKNAVCWCLLGALEKCYPKVEDFEEVRMRIRTEVGDSITAWNDSHSFLEVKTLVEKLDI